MTSFPPPLVTTSPAHELGLGVLNPVFALRAESTPTFPSEPQNFAALDVEAKMVTTTNAANLGDELIATAAEVQAACSSNPNSLLFEGNECRIEFEGLAVRLPISEGLRILSQLLDAGPGVEISALDLGLESHESEAQREKNAVKVASELGAENFAIDGVSGQELCDEKTFRDVEDELGLQLLELEEAKAMHQMERAEKLQDQICLMQKYLKEVGPLQRPISFPIAAERARKRVAIAVTRAIAAIRLVHPALAEHLKESVKIGKNCTYFPAQHRTWSM